MIEIQIKNVRAKRIEVLCRVDLDDVPSKRDSIILDGKDYIIVKKTFEIIDNKIKLVTIMVEKITTYI